jgi:hypothetical protein
MHRRRRGPEFYNGGAKLVTLAGDSRYAVLHSSATKPPPGFGRRSKTRATSDNASVAARGFILCSNEAVLGILDQQYPVMG